MFNQYTVTIFNNCLFNI